MVPPCAVPGRPWKPGSSVTTRPAPSPRTARCRMVCVESAAGGVIVKSACDNRALLDILANLAFRRAMLTSFFFFSSQNGFVLLPLYVKQLGGNEVEIGFVMGIYSAVGIVCQPLLGPWVDALGRRPFMLVGIACVLASALLAAVADNVPLLVAVRVLQGLGFSAFFV